MPAGSMNNPYYYGKASEIDPSLIYLLSMLQQMMGQTKPTTGEGIYNPFAWMDAGGLTPDQKRMADEARFTSERMDARRLNEENAQRQQQRRDGSPEMQRQIDAIMQMLAGLQGKPSGPAGGPGSILEVTIPGGTTGRMSDTQFGQAGLPANVSNWADVLSGAPFPGQSQESYLAGAQTTKPGAPQTETDIHSMYTGKTGPGMPPAGKDPKVAAADDLLFGKGSEQPPDPQLQALIDEASDLALILGIAPTALEKQKQMWSRLSADRMRGVVKKLQARVEKKMSWEGQDPEIIGAGE